MNIHLKEVESYHIYYSSYIIINIHLKELESDHISYYLLLTYQILLITYY